MQKPLKLAVDNAPFDGVLKRYETAGAIATVKDPGGVSTDAFGLNVVGECLAPRVKGGQTVIVDRQLPEPGDLAVIWFRGSEDCTLKILRTPLEFGYPHHPGSEVALLVELEQLNPPKRFRIDATRIECIARAVPAEVEAA